LFVTAKCEILVDFPDPDYSIIQTRPEPLPQSKLESKSMRGLSHHPYLGVIAARVWKDCDVSNILELERSRKLQPNLLPGGLGCLSKVIFIIGVGLGVFAGGFLAKSTLFDLK
jgi:hypothetical protein